LVLVRVAVIWIATIGVVWIVWRARSGIAVAVVAIAVTVVTIAITVAVVAGVLIAVPLVPIVGVASLPPGVA
jgi:hypothetical protein